MSRSVLAASFTILVLAFAPGCASPTDDTAGSGAGAAVVGSRAEVRIGEAEALARDHAAGRICESDAYSRSIVAKLAEAIAEDGSPRTIARVEASAILQQVVGKLIDFHAVLGHVKNDRGRISGLANVARTSGLELFGPAPGAYGNSTTLSLRPDGTATARVQHLDEQTGMPVWTASEIRYRVIEEPEGSLLVLESADGTTTRLAFSYHEQANQFFVHAPGQTVTGPMDWVYESFPSECEA
jgi:hypothetical protein